MQFYIVDVFANKKYSGNQLAVFIMDQKIKRSQMAKIAKEFNFSEVTFVNPQYTLSGYNVRIFTPDVEVPFAGHPTLGSAFIINEVLNNASLDTVTLDLEAGQIPVSIDKNYYEMKQNQPKFGKIYPTKNIAAIVSLKSKHICEEFPIEYVSTGLGSLIIPVKNKKALKKASINHKLYKEFLKQHGPCNLLLYTQNKDHLDVRVFVDDLGFGEDPATGSANGNLAAYLLKHQYFGKENSIEYRVLQGKEIGRPSELFVKASYDPETNTYDIRVGGKVFFIAQGTWSI